MLIILFVILLMGFPQKFPENAGIVYKMYHTQLLSEYYLPGLRCKIFIVFDPLCLAV